MADAQADVPTPACRRRAMTVEEQCDVMAQHGITFQKCSRENAKRFLQDNTYLEVSAVIVSDALFYNGFEIAPPLPVPPACPNASKMRTLHV
ncbi:hypothetical protein [Bifidobacterium ramosum]|uniref:Uncharacterized protein n=1 Tax=Bifidobacterium ramosum TaxID=1798158 RepID=A0A7K3TDR8_9BIFI|nr:hypothetical protein [Bifidobacterium ramosum]NEG72314.1 hypothetical protein [Bifidobacterium ramosum]